jgi:hypothetical protein
MDLDLECLILISARSTRASNNKSKEIEAKNILCMKQLKCIGIVVTISKPKKCDNYKINTGYGLLQGTLHDLSSVKVCGQFNYDILFENAA